MNNKILLLDDDEISLLILQNAFEMENYQVIMSMDSAMIIPLFEEHQPCAIIMDILMPNSDGFEMLRKIRALSQEVFVIAISANDLYLNMIKYQGANCVFPKSAQPDLLVQAVKDFQNTPAVNQEEKE